MTNICTQMFTIIINVDAHKNNELFKKLIDKKIHPNKIIEKMCMKVFGHL